MPGMTKVQRDIRRKERMLEHAVRIGNIRNTCHHLFVPRQGTGMVAPGEDRTKALVADRVLEYKCHHLGSRMKTPMRA